MPQLTRAHAVLSDIAVGTTLANSTPIPLESFSWGSIHIPAGSSITTLTWHVAPTVGGTFIALQDFDGTPVSQTVSAGKAYPLHPAIGSNAVAKAIADSAGSVDVVLKG